MLWVAQRMGLAAAAGLARLLCIIAPLLETRAIHERRSRYPAGADVGRRLLGYSARLPASIRVLYQP
jgi:hypothetical protein